MDYQQLLIQAQENIQNADFTALRQASTALPTYTPYRRQQHQAFTEAVNAGDWPQAIDLGNAALNEDALDADLHFAMAYCYKKLDRSGYEQWHGRFGAGLIRSVIESGDGRTMETAFRVLYFREVYNVLRALDLRLTSQELLHSPDGQAFDRMNCLTEEDTPVSLYFNISAYFGTTLRDSGENPS